MVALENITVIQLGKVGDILHSLPALRGLKKKHPNVHLRLICRQPFIKFIAEERCIDSIVPFDHHRWLKPLIDVSSDHPRQEFLEFLNGMREYVERIRLENDLIVNLTYSEASGLLAGLLSSDVVGLNHVQDQTVINGGWSQFFMSAVLRSSINRFHLSDLYRAQCGVLEVDVDDPCIAKMRDAYQSRGEELLENHGISGEEGLAGILHLSFDGKSPVWNDSQLKGFVESYLSGLKVGRLLVTADDERLREAIALAQNCPAVRVLSDVSNLHDLLSVFSVAPLVLGEGLGAPQLAVALGLPTFTIIHGSERYWEVGPYEKNHVILRALNGVVNPTLAGKSANSMRAGEPLDQMVPAGDFLHRLYLSKKSLHGLNRFHQVGGAPEESVEGWFIYSYNALRFEELHGSPMPPSEIQPSLTPMTMSILEVLLQTFEKGYDVADFGVQYGELLKKEWKSDRKSVAEIRTLGTRLRDVDGTLRLLSQSVPYVGPLVDEFEIEQLSLPLTDPYETICLGVECYQRLKVRFGLFHHKIRALLERFQSKIQGTNTGGAPPGKPPAQALDAIKRIRFPEIGI